MRSILRYITLPIVASLLTSVDAQWQPIASGTTDSLSAITFVDGRFLIAGESGRFLRSFDNGVSFSSTPGYTPHPSFLNAFDHLLFYDSLSGYGTFTGSCCELQRTDDGGMTWTSPGAPFPIALPFNDSDLVVFKGGPGIGFTTEGRVRYEFDLPLFADLDSVCGAPLPGWCTMDVFEEDTIYTGGGWGWTLTSSDRGATYDSAVFPYAAYARSAQWLGGDTLSYLDFESDVRISFDGGHSWAIRHGVPSYGNMLDHGWHMHNSAIGGVVDDQGMVNITQNSGATWAEVVSPTTNHLRDILFIDATHVLAIGDNGTILTSSDGGYTWEEEESGTTSRLWALAVSGNAVIAVGTDGVILRRYPAYDGMSTGVNKATVGPISIFPNPASEVINVHVSDTGAGLPMFTATDALGRTERLPAISGISGRWSMDISHLAHGPHTLELLHNGISTRRMFMVAH